MIRKYTGVSCYFCGAVDDLSYFRDHLICSDCIEKLKSDNPSSHSGETRPAQPKKRRNYRNQTELLHKLKQLMEKHPNVSQKELAEMLELSQGRVSQLKKTSTLNRSNYPLLISPHKKKSLSALGSSSLCNVRLLHNRDPIGQQGLFNNDGNERCLNLRHQSERIVPCIFFNLQRKPLPGP